MGRYTTWQATRRWIDKEIEPVVYRKMGYLRDGTMKLSCRKGRIISANGFLLGLTIREKGGEIRCFLLNGDLGTRTNRIHQEDLRQIAQSTGIPCLIVPFSAMDAGQMDKSSVRPLQINPDRWEDIEHEVAPWKEDEIRWRTYSRYESWGNTVRYQNGRIKNRSGLG